MEAELRQVTVCFVDVVGSTALGNEVDVEDLHELMEGLLGECTHTIENRSGRVLKYMGDGLLAVFGADATEGAAESAARDAVQAGIEMIERFRTDDDASAGLRIRVGLATGMALLGGGVEGDRSIRGAVVNLAARMEQTAPPGGLRISQETRAHVRGMFDMLAESVPAKGFDGPVRSYLVRGAAAEVDGVDGRGIEGAQTPLIGRDSELSRLLAAVKAAIVERSPTTVLMVGEAGLGKSRLLRELDASLARGAHQVEVLHGRAQLPTRNEPYGLLRNILLDRFSPGASPAAARAALAEAVSALTTDPKAADLVAYLVGIDTTPSPGLEGLASDARQLRNRAVSAVGAVVSRLARGAGGAEAVVLLLEDLHWSDDGTLEVIHELIDGASDVPIVVIGTTRPTPDTALASPRRWSDVIELGPLPPEASRALVRAVLHRLDEVPVELRRVVTEAGGGNPFYIEEIVQMLIDDGTLIVHDDGRWEVEGDATSELTMPTTLRDVMQARFDMLSDEERSCLQAASVVGHLFDDQSLGDLEVEAPASLDALTARGFVVEQPTHSGDGRGFAFQHHLLHQFSYESMLKPIRRQHHARMARWLEDRPTGGSSEHLGLIAEHHERSGDETAAALAWIRASQDAAGRGARDVAVVHAARALDLLADDAWSDHWNAFAVRERILALGDNRGEHDADLASMARLAELLDDDHLRAEHLLRVASAYMVKAEHADAAAAARDAAVLAESLGDDGRRAIALSTMAAAARRMGDHAASVELATQGVALAEHVGDSAAMLSALCTLTEALGKSGDWMGSRSTRHRALELAREIGDRHSECLLLNTDAGERSWVGDNVSARELFRQCVVIGREVGSVYVETIGGLNLSAVLLSMGDVAGAIAHAQAAADLAALSGTRDLEAAALTALGLAQVASGDVTAGRTCLERSTQLFIANDGPHYALEPTAALAALDVDAGDLDSARARIDLVLAGGELPQGVDDELRLRNHCLHVLGRLGDERQRAVLDDALDRIDEALEACTPEERPTLLASASVVAILDGARRAGYPSEEALEQRLSMSPPS